MRQRELFERKVTLRYCRLQATGIPLDSLKNFQRISLLCEHGTLNRKAYVTFPFGESS